MALVTTVKPTDLPVTLAEAKEQCRILPSDTSHDVKLLRHIEEATQSVETLTGARLRTQTVRLDLDGFPIGYYTAVDLGVYPVTAITAVAYDDADNSAQSLTVTTDYWQNLSGMYPYIQAVSYWPATYYAKPASVRITMTAGYATPDDVPSDLKHAVLMRVKEYFDNAGESITGQSVDSTVSTVKALTDMYRRVTV
jgi:uncharacterized phiE125 gp8 family phage protein